MSNYPPQMSRFIRFKSKIQIMKEAIEAFGYHVTIDYFDDESSSWIEVRKSENKKEFFSIGFDYSGMKCIDFGLVKGSNKIRLNQYV